MEMEYNIWLLVAINIFFAITAFGPPFYFIFRTGRFVLGFFLAWFCMFLAAFLFCVVIPAIAYRLFGKHVFLHFPEAIGAVGYLFMGWLPALFVTGISLLSRLAARRFWPTLLKKERR